MPRAKFDHIVSFSSEDTVHNANNLLNNDVNKKWRCKTPGESSATVIIQLNKLYKITGIDIGNENSSFVEVFVGRSSSPQESNYQILLAMSSFMTPMEARDLTNCNRVRLFTAKDFAKPACDEKWDRIKVVCTQPFNKDVHYGLSFIVAHTSDEPANNDSIHLGKFTLKGSDSPEYIAPGNLFARKIEEPKDTEKLPATLEMKRASTSEWLEKHGAPKCKPVKMKPTHGGEHTKKAAEKPSGDESKNRNSLDLYYDPLDDEPHDKIDVAMNKLKEENKKKKEHEQSSSRKGKAKADTPKKGHGDTKKDNSHSTASTSAIKRKQKTEDKPKKKSKMERKMFEELLNGVVFTISGIQNPERANLRQQALEMGARYKPDWDYTCTHLM